MDGQSGALSASEFLDRLERDDFSDARRVTLVGMAKKPDGGEKAIQFTQADCTDWTVVPLESIASVEVLRTVACKDHSHPLVKLELKPPDTPEGRLFSSLLTAATPAAPPVGPSPLGMAPGFPALSSRFGATWPDRGCRLKCYPAVCPNPSGHGTIWCTKCFTECDPGSPELALGLAGW